MAIFNVTPTPIITIIKIGNAVKAVVIGGGKFANGAVTGAFSRMYNEDAAGHSQERNLGITDAERQLVGIYIGHPYFNIGK